MLADAQISSLGYLWLDYDRRRGEGGGVPRSMMGMLVVSHT